MVIMYTEKHVCLERMLVNMLFMQHRGTHNEMLTNCWKTSAHRNSQFRSLEYETSTACVRSKWDTRGPLPFLQGQRKQQKSHPWRQEPKPESPKILKLFIGGWNSISFNIILGAQSRKNDLFLVLRNDNLRRCCVASSLQEIIIWRNQMISRQSVHTADLVRRRPNIQSKLDDFPQSTCGTLQDHFLFRRNMVLAVGRLARRLGNPLPSWHMPQLVGKLKLGYTVPPKRNILGRDNEMVNHG